MADPAAAYEPTNTTNWFCEQTGIYKSKYPSRPLPINQNLDLVSHLFSYKHNGVSALIDSHSGLSLSYPTLHQMVKSIASGLQLIGFSQGDVVLLLLPNSIYLPVVLLGVLSLGAIATTMNPLSSLIEIEKQVKSCNVRLAFTVSESVGKFEQLGVRVVAVPSTPHFVNTEFVLFSKLISSRSSWVKRPVIHQDDTAVILFSSGTTGVSKGVVLTHRNLISVVELFVRFGSIQQCGNEGHKNVYLATIPMFHVYGLSLLAIGLLSLGTSIVVMNKYDPNEMARAIDRYGVTHFPTVPPILVALTRQKAQLGDSHFQSLKQVSCRAAPTNEKMIHDFFKVLPRVDFIQGYGLTESAAVGTRGLNTRKFKKYTSMGLLAPNMQAKVVNWSSGSCMPPCHSGELWLKGPGVMKGYLNNEEATNSTIDKDGWLHTGDIVHFDQDGYIFILDRLKEMIKFKGSQILRDGIVTGNHLVIESKETLIVQIAPADLENVLISHPEILDVAVTGFRDEEAGEIPVAFVVKRHGSALSQTDVMSFVSSKVAPYKKIRKVVFMSSIPKSPAGKILRRELKNNLVSRI